jgi:hypothetical protein
MFHPVDEARRERADSDRLEAFYRCLPMDAHHAGAMLGMILAEKLLGWRPPWRRPAGREVPTALVLSLTRPRRLGALFRPRPPLRVAAND